MMSFSGKTARLFVTCMALAAFLPAIARAKPADSSVVLSKPWMKLIVPNRPAAGYFTIENHGKSPVKLVGASSPGCESLMLHRSIMKNDIMKMVMVDSVPVEAGGRLTFAPGGYHLMCMKPNERVRPGKNVPVTLEFSDGASLTADFPVKDAKGGM